MKKLKQNLSNIKEVLSREQLREITGGSGSGNSGDDCAGVCFFCTTAEGCGKAIGRGRIHGLCYVAACQVDTPHPCAYA